MTEWSNYQQFDGVDWSKVLFSDNMQTSMTHTETAGQQTCSNLPRPITKTTDRDKTSNTSAITTTSMTDSYNDNVRRMPELRQDRRWRVRTASCGSSGGGDGGGGDGIQCVFCRRNGETREFYSTHTLKDWRGLVVCPVLRAYTCPQCGATGDQAHTVSHCPLSPRSGEPSLPARLRTRRSSCGRAEYTSKPR